VSLFVVPLLILSAARPSSHVELDRAIQQAVSYLERACGADGRFTYEVDVASGREINAHYNIVRHAGAIYALVMANRAHPDPQAVQAMVRAAGFLRRNYTAEMGPDKGAVLFNPASVAPQITVLGANGLGLLALAGVRDAAPDSVPLQELQSIGNFILSLQREDGSFIQIYQKDRGPVRGRDVLYYPGEAAMGLIALYQTDHSRKWLVAAAKALSYLARSRAGKDNVPPDHWAMIATAAIMLYADQIADVISYQELEAHAIQVCRSLLDGLEDQQATGSVATRLEGLLAAAEFLGLGERDKIDAAVSQQLPRLIQSQIASGEYVGAVPNRFKDSTMIRIDLTQHTLCAWLVARHGGEDQVLQVK
jgi:hypothetical protein